MGWVLWQTVEHMSPLRRWPPSADCDCQVETQGVSRVARAAVLLRKAGNGIGLWDLVCDLGPDPAPEWHSKET